MANQEQVIREFGGKILGYLITKPNGDIEARDFGRRILGYYVKQHDYTTDFYGRIIARGNTVVSLIYNK